MNEEKIFTSFCRSTVKKNVWNGKKFCFQMGRLSLLLRELSLAEKTKMSFLSLEDCEKLSPKKIDFQMRYILSR